MEERNGRPHYARCPQELPFFPSSPAFCFLRGFSKKPFCKALADLHTHTHTHTISAAFHLLPHQDAKCELPCLRIRLETYVAIRWTAEPEMPVRTSCPLILGNINSTGKMCAQKGRAEVEEGTAGGLPNVLHRMGFQNTTTRLDFSAENPTRCDWNLIQPHPWN